MMAEVRQRNLAWCGLAGMATVAGLTAAGVARLRRSGPARRVGRWLVLARETRAGAAVAQTVAIAVERMFARLRGVMTRGEHALYEGLREGREPVCLLRTGTRVDVGEWCNQWWGGACLWLAVLGGEVLLFAHGRRPFVERHAATRLRGSQYNAVMSELVLAEEERVALWALRLRPVEGRRVLVHLAGPGDKAGT